MYFKAPSHKGQKRKYPTPLSMFPPNTNSRERGALWNPYPILSPGTRFSKACRITALSGVSGAEEKAQEAFCAQRRCHLQPERGHNATVQSCRGHFSGAFATNLLFKTKV